MLEGPEESAPRALEIVKRCMENPFNDFGLKPLLVKLEVDAKSAKSKKMRDESAGLSALITPRIEMLLQRVPGIVAMFADCKHTIYGNLVSSFADRWRKRSIRPHA